MIVYGNDRLDEISVSDSTSVAEVRDGKVKEYEIAPEDFGLPRGSKEDIVGGTADENASSPVEFWTAPFRMPSGISFCSTPAVPCISPERQGALRTAWHWQPSRSTAERRWKS